MRRTSKARLLTLGALFAVTVLRAAPVKDAAEAQPAESAENAACAGEGSTEAFDLASADQPPSEDAGPHLASITVDEGTSQQVAAVQAWLRKAIEDAEAHSRHILSTGGSPKELAELLTENDSESDPTLETASSVLASLEQEVAAARATVTDIVTWEAQRPPASGGTADLIAQARDFSAERRNCRSLRKDFRTICTLLDTWQRASYLQTVEDLRHLTQMQNLLSDDGGVPDCLKELTGWCDTLRQRLEESAADPDSDSNERLLDLIDHLYPEGSAAPSSAHAELEDCQKQREELQKLLDSAAEADPVKPSVARRGKAEELVSKAKAYPDIRQKRLQIQTELTDFLRAVDGWLTAWKLETAADVRALTRILQMAESEETGDAVKNIDIPAGAEGLQDFEFYTLQEPQSLQEISALPSLYGDPAKWQILQKANPGAPASPDEQLPAGTLLVVPRLASGESQSQSLENVP